MKELQKLQQGKLPDREDIVKLLSLEAQNMEELFQVARSIRKKIFKDRVFLYGFVYFSTWCRNDCNFCYFRNSNEIPRYRKTPQEIIAIASSLKDSGVHLIDLTMGEDIKYHEENFASLLSMVKEIKMQTGLPVMISPGLIDKRLIQSFGRLGADWYALYQETHNPKLFETLRKDQSYSARISAKIEAIKQGMLVEEGILVGVGETLEDIADSILEMGRIGAKQVRVMSFVPQKGSPMEHVKTPQRELELKIIAILRVMYPEALIPASLDVEGIKGLKDRMNAGASVVTSIIPPKSGLGGVAQNSMDVDDGGRSVEEATVILNKLGIEVATATEYKDYIKKLKRA